MIFLGILFPEEKEQEIMSNSKWGVSNAANTFQWKMIRGICENGVTSLKIINALPVGTWPRGYRIPYLKDKIWSWKGIECHEVGSPNLSIFKQIVRAIKVKRLLKQSKDESEIILFTAYLPFLYACNSLGHNYHVTAIITDIPEFYDIHETSNIRKLLRSLHNKLVYHYMQRVDRFVLLTEQMKEPLHVGSRPYLIMEGICDNTVAIKEIDVADTFSILYSGRLDRQYGLENLLNAFDMIEDSSIELWICGSGEMEEEIKHHAERDSRIRYWGFVSHEDCLILQHKASILINPRTNAGEYTKYSFPSKILEYMSSGTPVAMYQLDGVPKDYDPYLFYIPEGTAESIRDTLIQIKRMDALARWRIGNSAQKFVLEKKNRNVQMHRILKFIKENR